MPVPAIMVAKLSGHLRLWQNRLLIQTADGTGNGVRQVVRCEENKPSRRGSVPTPPPEPLAASAVRPPLASAKQLSDRDQIDPGGNTGGTSFMSTPPYSVEFLGIGHLAEVDAVGSGGGYPRDLVAGEIERPVLREGERRREQQGER